MAYPFFLKAEEKYKRNQVLLGFTALSRIFQVQAGAENTTEIELLSGTDVPETYVVKKPYDEVVRILAPYIK